MYQTRLAVALASALTLAVATTAAGVSGPINPREPMAFVGSGGLPIDVTTDIVSGSLVLPLRGAYDITYAEAGCEDVERTLGQLLAYHVALYGPAMEPGPLCFECSATRETVRVDLAPAPYQVQVTANFSDTDVSWGCMWALFLDPVE